MSPLAKVFVVLVTILNLFFLGTSATLYQTQANWREVAQGEADKRKSDLDSFKDMKEALQGENTQLQSNLSNKSEEATRLGTEKQGLEADVADKAATITRLEARVTELQSHVQQKDGHIQEKDGEIARLTTSNEQFRSDASESSEEAKKARQLMTAAILDKQQLEEQLEASSIEVAAYKNKSDEQSLLLDKIAELDPSMMTRLGKPLPNPVDTVVVSYDAAEQILVFSAGADDGVAVGDEFTIFDGASLIGKAKITRTGADVAGASIIYTVDGKSVQPGQSASSRFNY